LGSVEIPVVELSEPSSEMLENEVESTTVTFEQREFGTIASHLSGEEMKAS
jgi:hypothetical protein